MEEEAFTSLANSLVDAPDQKPEIIKQSVKTKNTIKKRSSADNIPSFSSFSDFYKNKIKKRTSFRVEDSQIQSIIDSICWQSKIRNNLESENSSNNSISRFHLQNAQNNDQNLSFSSLSKFVFQNNGKEYQVFKKTLVNTPRCSQNELVNLQMPKQLQLQLNLTKRNIDKSSVPVSSQVSLDSQNFEYSFSQSNQRIGDNLIEDFIIIGPDQKQLKEIYLQDDGLFQGEPQVLYSYKDQIEKRSVLGSLVFPFGVEIEKSSLDRTARIKEYLFRTTDSEVDENCFVINLRSDDSWNPRETPNPVLEQVNPDRKQYCICLKIKDFFYKKFVSENQKNLKTNPIFQTEYVLAFLTYYPMQELYMKYMKLNFIDIKRKKLFDLYSFISYSHIFQQYQILQKQSVWINLCKQIKNLENFAMKLSVWIQCTIFILLKLQQLYLKCLEKFLKSNFNKVRKLRLSMIKQRKLQYMGKNFLKCVMMFKYIIKHKYQINISYKLPNHNDLIYLEPESVACVVFSTFDYQNLILIIFSIMLEQKLVFFSENQALVTSTILFFSSILKPFRYSFPIIFSLPESIHNFIEAPLPILLGINQPISFLAQKNISKEKNNLIVINLDNQSSCINYSNITQMRNINQSQPYFVSQNPQLHQLFLQFKQSMPQKDAIQYQYFGQQREIVRKFLTTLQSLWETNIIEKIPVQNFCTREDKIDLDYKSIKTSIINNNDEEYQFLTKFLDSQMFSYYLEQLYDQLTEKNVDRNPILKISQC